MYSLLEDIYIYIYIYMNGEYFYLLLLYFIDVTPLHLKLTIEIKILVTIERTDIKVYRTRYCYTLFKISCVDIGRIDRQNFHIDPFSMPRWTDIYVRLGSIT
jgi:hypothetical protein